MAGLHATVCAIFRRAVVDCIKRCVTLAIMWWKWVYLCGIFGLTAVQAAVVVDFDSGYNAPGDWNGFSTVGSPVGFGQVAGGGLDGSDALAPGRNAALVYNEQSFSAQRFLWEVGIFMRYQTPTRTGNATELVALGAFGDTAAASGETFNITTTRTGLSGGNLYGFRAVIQSENDPVDNEGIVRLRTINVIDHPSAQGPSVFSDFTAAQDGNLLVHDNWYFFQLSVSYDDASGRYDAVSRLFSATSSGEVQSLLLSNPLTDQENTAFANDADGVYAFISGRHFAGDGAGALDNFTLNLPIPEPTTVAMLGMGFLLLHGLRRQLAACQRGVNA